MHLDTVYPAEEEGRNGFAGLLRVIGSTGRVSMITKGNGHDCWSSRLCAILLDAFQRASWLIAANAAEEELVPDFPSHAELEHDCRAALIFEACRGFGRRPLNRSLPKDRRIYALSCRAVAPMREAAIIMALTPSCRWLL